MAIDTAEKRRSAATVAGYFMAPGVMPNATPDAQWRTQAAWSYSGLIPDPDAGGDAAFNKYALKSVGRMMGYG